MSPRSKFKALKRLYRSFSPYYDFHFLAPLVTSISKHLYSFSLHLLSPSPGVSLFSMTFCCQDNSIGSLTLSFILSSSPAGSLELISMIHLNYNTNHLQKTCRLWLECLQLGHPCSVGLDFTTNTRLKVRSESNGQK